MLVAAAGAGWAEPLSLAIVPADLDAANCRAFGDGRDLGAAPEAALAACLGLNAATGAVEWTVGPLAGEARHFRLTFRAPLELGAVCVEQGGLELARLVRDADYPGDVWQESQWTPVPGGSVKTLPAGVRVRAVRFTHRVQNLPWANDVHPSRLGRVLLLRDRVWCPASVGSDGSVGWDQAPLPRGGIADVWTGYWPVPVPVSGVALFRAAAAVARLPAAVEAHPLVAGSNEWQAVTVAAPAAPAVLELGGAEPCRALRVALPRAGRGPPPAGTVVPLVRLAAGEAVPAGFVPAPPFRFAYDMPLDGFVAIRVADDQGRDVRRLVAEVRRAAGAVQEPWDLQDDAGRYVVPGRYRWRGLARPPLKLTYEYTALNPGHPPWLAPQPSSWWMADHCPPRAVCAVGDRLFFGAQGAEFGVPLIATDLDGVKVWHGNQGVERLASDGRYAYVVNDDTVVRFGPVQPAAPDPAGIARKRGSYVGSALARDVGAAFAREEVLRWAYSEEVPRRTDRWIQAEHSGAACGGGLLAVSFNAAEPPWIASAFRAGDVDLRRCFPPVTGEKVHETAYTPAERILGTFLTITSSQQARIGPAVRKGALAHLLVLALGREVPVGSVLVPDGGMTVWALKPGKALPPALVPASQSGAPDLKLEEEGAGEEEQDFELLEGDDTRFAADTWTRLAGATAGRADVLAAPEKGVQTRCLVFSAPDLESMDFALVLNRRYRNAAGDARLVALEGRAAGGGWQTSRTAERPLSQAQPATAAFVWPAPVPLRGFALLNPMRRAGVAFDVWTGDPKAEVDEAAIRSDANWQQVHYHRQNEEDMKMSWHSHAVVHVDLGATREVRALRVRLVEMPTRGAAAAGGFGGLVAFQPLGGDPELPRSLAQRITLVQLPRDGEKARVLRHLAAPQPGPLAFDAAGALYAGTAQGVVRIANPAAQEGAAAFDVIVPTGRVAQARALAFDREGRLCVLSGATRAVHVFDAHSGEPVRTIGTPGGARVGPWDPTRLVEPVAMAFDAAGKLWIVDQSFQPKRLSRWSADGRFEKELLGPTHYGGGGFVDPRDPFVVNHLGMKFRVDPTNRVPRLEALLYGYESRGMYCPDRPLYVRDRRFLVGDQSAVIPFGDEGPTVTICEETNGVAVPLAAAGLLSGWTGFGGNEAALAAHRNRDLRQTSFVWCDRNRDRAATPDEVQVLGGAAFGSSAGVGDDLAIHFTGDGAGWRLPLRELRADGLPLYDLADLKKVPGLSGACLGTADGALFVMGHSFLDPQGKVQWTYPDRYRSVQYSYRTPWGFYGRPPGELCGGMWPAGQFTVGAESYFCVNGNNGDYYAFTRDGLLAAAIVGGPAGYGRRFFAMPECEPGVTDLSDLRKTVEDFRGWVCATPEGRVYATLGKNHVTTIRCDGLEQAARLAGTFEVAAADLQAAARWQAERARLERALRRPAIATLPYRSRPPKLDGDTYTDWPDAVPLPVHEVRDAQDRLVEAWSALLAYDDRNLYVAVRATDPTPLVNRAPADERRRVFQFGDGVDLQLGLDAAAPAEREEAVAGDVRLVLTEVDGKPLAMLYRYKAAGAGEPVRFTSPTGETVVDEVRELAGVAVAVRRGEGSWFLEAAVPWKELGGKAPAEGAGLRGDVGVLVSDAAGQSTLVRYYWANKSNVVMSDLPSEARVLPGAWGEFRFAPPMMEDLMKPTDDDAVTGEELGL
jgi:hypothetical protein